MRGFHIYEQLIFKISFPLKVNTLTCGADNFSYLTNFLRKTPLA